MGAKQHGTLPPKPSEIAAGRAPGDHGTPAQAIEFALDKLGPYDRVDDFLLLWREGNLVEFPDYYAWLEEHEQGSKRASRRTK